MLFLQTPGKVGRGSRRRGCNRPCCDRSWCVLGTRWSRWCRCACAACNCKKSQYRYSHNSDSVVDQLFFHDCLLLTWTLWTKLSSRAIEPMVTTSNMSNVPAIPSQVCAISKRKAINRKHTWYISKVFGFSCQTALKNSKPERSHSPSGKL